MGLPSDRDTGGFDLKKLMKQHQVTVTDAQSFGAGSSVSPNQAARFIHDQQQRLCAEQQQRKLEEK